MTAPSIAALVASLRALAERVPSGTTITWKTSDLTLEESSRAALIEYTVALVNAAPRLLAALESEYARGLNDAAKVCEGSAENPRFVARYIRAMAGRKS